MKKADSKEPKALLEAREWKAKVSNEIRAKGWKQFSKDVRAASKMWLAKAKTSKAAHAD